MADKNWPHSEFRSKFVGKEEIQKLIPNVMTQLSWSQKKDFWSPSTANFAEFNASYVVSPYSALILYSRQELKKLPMILGLLGLILLPLSYLLKAMRLNQSISINNWLLSTNLYPKNSETAFSEWAKESIRKADQHFIIFRSLNYFTNADLIHGLRRLGFSLIPSRQVYFFDFRIGQQIKSKNMFRDQKLLDRSSLQIVNGTEFSDQDFQRSEELYALLYLEKYSQYNPAFSASYLKLCQESGVMKLFGLRDEKGELQGVVGYFIVDEVLTVPIVGYDTRRPQKEGLYRLLIALALRYAKERKLLVNLSSGASEFKRLRGGRPVIEYSAVYIKHLSWPRRIGFRILQALLFSIALPLLKIFKL